MKKFKFFALAFAALSFAACSDDVLDGKGGNTGIAGDGTPAYLTISFSANSGNSSRSTADDANNNGDQDGNAEDSNHHSTGTENEQAIKDVLVVIVPTEAKVGEGNVNFAQLYTTGLSSTEGENGKFTIQNASNNTYVNDKAIELTTGEYNVLVVANPVDELKIQGLGEGIRNDNRVETLYAEIVNGEYDLSGDENESAYQSLAKGEGTGGNEFRIMMANKGYNADGDAYTVNLTSENDADNPAVAEIEIERVYSKITFREKNNNIYKVPVRIGKVEASTVDAAIDMTPGSTPTYEYRKLNVAKDLDGQLVYVRFDTDADGENPEFKGVYLPDPYETTASVTKPAETPEGTSTSITAIIYTPITPSTTAGEGYYRVNDTSNPTASLTYQTNADAPTREWYVKLEGYALVNLSKSVYYVRHTTSSSTGLPEAFGKLNGIDNYLYTPYWNEKNSVSLSDVDEANETIANADEWFYNTLADVSEESKGLTISGGTIMNGSVAATYYKPLSSLISESASVDGNGSQHTDVSSLGLGKRMAYCFENSTDINHQMHGISTGISFVARIYEDASCATPLNGPLYKYSNYLFDSLKAIEESFGSTLSDDFKELVQKEEAGTEITREDLAGLPENISLYNGNFCYYYTTEIKHYDNGDNASLGNMEFAIMRNNIYSLAVSDINMIGDPFVDPTPNIPNEYPKAKTALNVQVEILPWIVRYNDIEF